jgi:hypothetical protein
MDTRGIINFRTWSISTGEKLSWDSLSSNPRGPKGYGIPQEGTGLKDKSGGEIFRGDIVSREGVFFLVGYEKGGYRLEYLSGEHRESVWLHDEDPANLEIVGNTKNNSDFVVSCINSNLKSKRT